MERVRWTSMFLSSVLLNRGCGPLQTGRRLHCSHRRDKTVSSPSTQEVGLDLWNRKNKKNLAWRTPIIPIHQREQSSTSSHPFAFPGVSLIRSHSGVQNGDDGPLLDLSSDCSQGAALTHLYTPLVNSLSLSFAACLSTLVSDNHSSLKVIAQGSSEQSRPIH